MTFEYRRDGWPLCPRCGEDELWSERVPADASGPLQCYRCRWEGTVPAATRQDREAAMTDAEYEHYLIHGNPDAPGRPRGIIRDPVQRNRS